MTVREAGRLGGLIGGRKGGLTVKAARGVEFYQEIGRLGGQRDPRGQHQLAALQQVRRVRQLKYVHPANPGAQAARARDHLRAAPADHVEAEQVTHGGQHDKARHYM